jgi:hypothetical protein
LEANRVAARHILASQLKGAGQKPTESQKVNFTGEQKQSLPLNQRELYRPLI